MKFSYLFLLLIFISTTIHTYAQEIPEENTRWDMVKHDGVSVFKGVKNAFTQPIRWQKKD